MLDPLADGCHGEALEVCDVVHVDDEGVESMRASVRIEVSMPATSVLAGLFALTASATVMSWSSVGRPSPAGSFMMEG